MTTESLTAEKLMESLARLRKEMGPPSMVYPGGGSLYPGIRMIDNPLMTETEMYEAIVRLTFRQRWIEPLLSPATMPFEPWVMERKEIRTRQIPMKSVYIVSGTIFIHPELRAEVFKKFIGG